MAVDKREHRRKFTAEIFTPPGLVFEMLSKLPKEVWEENKTFCDPACGNGNFLVMILWEKIRMGHNLVDSLKTLYGADIMPDNIMECRFRLLQLVSVWEQVTIEHIKAVFNNIKWVPDGRGSLDYDFSFKEELDLTKTEEWLSYFNNISNVNLPVEATPTKIIK